MLVTVEALEAFVTILPDRDMVSAIRGEKVRLPAAVADKLVKAGLVVKDPAPKGAPENKADGPAPEAKKAASPKRAAVKKAVPPAE